MWRTPDGDRVLEGKQKKLFCVLADLLAQEIWDDIDEAPEWRETYSGPFNALSANAKFAVLHKVAKGLLDPKTPAVEPNAYEDSCIYAVFRTALGYEDDPKIMKLLADVAGGDIHDDTDDLVEQAADTVLSDRDFNIPALQKTMDMHPEKARMLLDGLRVNHEYLSAIVREPSESEIKGIHDELNKLLRGRGKSS
jgi:hypothetical protein